MDKRPDGKWNRKVNNRIKNISKVGLHYEMHMISVIFASKNEDWVPREKYWISYFKKKGHKLLNKNHGGSGVLVHSEDYKRRHSLRTLGVPKGPCSRKHRKALSKAHLGIKYGDRKSKCLTRRKAEKIRELSAKGIMHKKIAKRFNVSMPTVTDVVYFRSWK